MITDLLSGEEQELDNPDIVKQIGLATAVQYTFRQLFGSLCLYFCF